MPGVILVIALVGGLLQGEGSVQSTACRATPFPDPARAAEDTAPRCPAGVVLPQVTKGPHPDYTAEAMRKRIQGLVEIEAVVDTDGKITGARVVKSLHPDLDESALRAVRKWEFAPAKLEGKPLPVLVQIEMTFTIRK